MSEAGACGSWSVKDMLAHLAVENVWRALQLERRARGEVPDPAELQRVEEVGLADNERRNTYYAQLHKDLDLASVGDWDRRASVRLFATLAALPQAPLQEPDWWTYDQALGSVFYLNHELEHVQDMQRWLESEV